MNPDDKTGIVVVLGSPCSGKGTQCRQISEATGAVHISTGDIFRDAVHRHTELGVRVREYLQRNEFVPDDLVTSFVLERLSHPDIAAKGCLLDGFPRTADQARALMKVHGNNVRVLLLEVQERVAIPRAAGRLIDAKSGVIYHREFLPPPAEASVLERLADGDRAEFRKRLDVFKHQLRRVLPCLPPVVRIRGEQEPAAVFASVMRALSKTDQLSSEARAPQPQQHAQCVICFDQPAAYLVTPCGHQCGCEACLTQVMQTSGRCPICRNSITALQKVFRVGGPDQEGETGRGASRASTVVGSLHTDVEELIEIGAQLDDDEWPDVDEDAEPCAGQQGSQVHMSAEPAQDAPPAAAEAVNVCVHIEVPEAQARQPVDIACVIDTSGSMNTLATREDETGGVIRDGLSILDIVKHSVKTVINILEDGDRLTLIGFSDHASVVLPLRAMDASGKNTATAALEEMHAHDCTNLWAGVHAAMESLREDGQRQRTQEVLRRQSILLLTDGMPNCKPPAGEVSELQRYFEQHPSFASALQMSTFGFGYQLDSKLLLQLAEAAKGTTAFIPDAVITGTVFVNAVANALSVHTAAPSLHLTAAGGGEFAGEVLGDYPTVETTWGRVVDLGPLHHGQSRDVVVPMKLCGGPGEVYLHAALTAVHPITGEQQLLASHSSAERTGSMRAALGSLRSQTVSVAKKCVEDGELRQGKRAVDSMDALLRSFGEQAELAALKADVQGRMMKALKGEARFKRWGRHYLRAITRAHQLQVCTNFMDGGLQCYGGELFRDLRSKGDAVFLSLPPPRPQAAPHVDRSTTHGSTTIRAHAPSPPDMSSYYAGAGGGCFHPASTVTVQCIGAEGTPSTGTIRIANVKKGDRLAVAGGWSVVRCLVRISRSASKPMVALPGGLLVTPRHPVRIGGEWTQPCQLPEATWVHSGTDSVYNVLLESGHVLLVDGVECITWGHRFKEAAVAHDFFGTSQVEAALQNLDGFADGFVSVRGCLRSALHEDAPVLGLLGWECCTRTAAVVPQDVEVSPMIPVVVGGQ